uniref:Vesicle transport v-SNARE N-terminal domain-containing protein n=1 Tax=Peronospora matthiolae TaxID=2874970 RepID=A0AAV1UKS3_9STRA
MTTIFDGYDEEYRTLTTDISTKLREIASYDEQRDKKKSSIVHVGDLLTQATQLIQQMELEVRSLDTATRRDLSKKVDQYKKSLASLSAQHNKIRENEERDGLFGDRDCEATSDDHRSRLSAATNKMKGTTDKLTAARKEIADTEEVALAISDDLGRNREKIEATHAKVKGVNEMARRGGNIVSRMAARNKRQRMALSIAASFIIIAIVLLIYFGIFNKT